MGGEEVATHASGSRLAATKVESFWACVVGATVPRSYAGRERVQTLGLPPIWFVRVAAVWCPSAGNLQERLVWSMLEVIPWVQQKLLPRVVGARVLVLAWAARSAARVSAAEVWHVCRADKVEKATEVSSVAWLAGADIWLVARSARSMAFSLSVASTSCCLACSAARWLAVPW